MKMTKVSMVIMNVLICLGVIIMAIGFSYLSAKEYVDGVFLFFGGVLMVAIITMLSEDIPWVQENEKNKERG